MRLDVSRRNPAEIVRNYQMLLSEDWEGQGQLDAM